MLHVAQRASDGAVVVFEVIVLDGRGLCLWEVEVGRIFMPKLLAGTKTAIIGTLCLLKLLDRHGLC